MKAQFLLATLGLTTLLMISACGDSSSVAPSDLHAASSPAKNLKACKSNHKDPNIIQVIDTGDRIDVQLRGHNLDSNFDVVLIYGRKIVLRGAEKITTLLTSFNKGDCSLESGVLTCAQKDLSGLPNNLYVNGARQFSTFVDNGPAEFMPVYLNSNTIKAVVSQEKTEISWLNDVNVEVLVSSDCSSETEAETATTEEIRASQGF